MTRLYDHAIISKLSFVDMDKRNNPISVMFGNSNSPYKRQRSVIVYFSGTITITIIFSPDDYDYDYLIDFNRLF